MFTLKNKPVYVNRHAFDGMNAERPPIRWNELWETIRDPDKIEGRQYMKWVGFRTIIVYMVECPDYWDVQSVSATRRKIV